MNFSELGLGDEVLQAIDRKGFEEPTDIQRLTIPVMLENEVDIIAQAQTGTGKTAAFGLPLMEMIKPSANVVQALVLVPTRELAIQVSEELNSYRSDKNIRVIPIYGGQSIDQQLRRLKRGVHIVVGTPGRIIDHLGRNTLKVDKIEHLILDEADEMLNMGFIEDIEEIMKHTKTDKRTLLFSATIPPRIKELAEKYLTEFKVLSVTNKQLTTDLTEQIYFEVKAADKFEALCRIIDIENEFYGLVFCRTKNDVDEIVGRLIDRGYDAEPIHSDISQAQRERTMDKFKKRRINLLIATDVAARGLDVSDLTHVINYALPYDPESYVHRIGRTGRAGKQGTAITFITPSEYKRLMFIQKKAKSDIKKSRLPKIQEIIQAKKEKYSEDLNLALQTDIDDKYFTWAKDLLAETDAEKVVATLLFNSFAEEMNPDVYQEIHEPGSSRKQIDNQGKTRLFVALGRKDNYHPRKLVDLIVSKVNIKPRQIKDVQILDNFSFINVPFNKAEEIIRQFKEKGKKPVITHAKSKEKKFTSSRKQYNKRKKGI